MIELKGRTITATVESEAGLTILDHAIKHKVDWSFSCTRGTCARCRCLVSEGKEFLEEITDQEWDRLEPEEFEEGFRLGCQAVVKEDAGRIVAANKTYF
ncbi:(2Fe-2S)-binding protein [Paenibacillus sp. 1011MAR3C5]|uniref:2Fe-2S iron-sulfur cluster-binding protein n=1 Tax=Paenibacillus sp. 1011MAR3C5 TaxID=1675787 RepID=UPI000E6C2F27|nr:2Fe-2S iron-sulfur cluster-binding protein [Paenibacillus sp. 1011MAR3C5]RJE90030.1 (2Fe-2S)-binding protein [Paenibacillus sp. 1011MAR3C5]